MEPFLFFLEIVRIYMPIHIACTISIVKHIMTKSCAYALFSFPEIRYRKISMTYASTSSRSLPP